MISDDLLSKLCSEVAEVRHRAAENIEAKIRAGIVEKEALADNRLWHRLLTWVNNKEWPQVDALWNLIAAACESPQGKEYFFKAAGGGGLKGALRKATHLDTSLPALRQILLDADEIEDVVEVPDEGCFEASTGTMVESESSRFPLAEASVPRHLLRRQPQSRPASSDSTISKPLTPVTRDFFKRHVHFALGGGCGDEEEMGRGKLFLPSVGLAARDREVLDGLLRRLRSRDSVVIREALETIRFQAMKDFPAEVWLQNSEVLRTILELCTFNPNLPIQMLACECLTLMTSKLRKRFLFHREMESTLSRPPSPPVDDLRRPSDRTEEDTLGAADISSIDLNDFAFLVLSGATSILRSVNDLGLVLRSRDLFRESVEFSVQIGLPLVWASKASSSSGFVQEILRDILGDVKHGLARVKGEFGRRTGEPDTLTKLRRVHLMLVECSLLAFNLFEEADKEVNLLATQLCHDPFLLLSHPEMHSRLLAAAGNANARAHFDQVCATIKEVESAVGYLRGRSDRIEDAAAAVKLLPFHESRRLVPMLMQECKSRGEGEQELPELVVCLLRSPDLQLQTNAYLELHRVVQECLGIGNAIDPGRALAEHCMCQLSRPDVLDEVVKFGLFNRSTHVQRASEEMLTYAIKSRLQLREHTWNTFRALLKAYFPLLECYVGGGSEGGLLGKVLLKNLASPTTSKELTRVEILQVRNRLEEENNLLILDFLAISDQSSPALCQATIDSQRSPRESQISGDHAAGQETTNAARLCHPGGV